MRTSVRRWLLLSLFPVLSLADARVPRRPLLHDAYIWQRQWNGNVATAMQQSADLVHVWRVLAATSDARGHLQPVTVDWLALAGSGRALVPVIRIEGQLTQWDHDTLSEEIYVVLKRWRDG